MDTDRGTMASGTADWGRERGPELPRPQLGEVSWLWWGAVA